MDSPPPPATTIKAAAAAKINQHQQAHTFSSEKIVINDAILQNDPCFTFHTWIHSKCRAALPADSSSITDGLVLTPPRFSPA